MTDELLTILLAAFLAALCVGCAGSFAEVQFYPRNADLDNEQIASIWDINLTPKGDLQFTGIADVDILDGDRTEWVTQPGLWYTLGKYLDFDFGLVAEHRINSYVDRGPNRENTAVGVSCRWHN